MNGRRVVQVAILLLGLVVVAAVGLAFGVWRTAAGLNDTPQAAGSAFTYQGKLEADDLPVNDICDMRFGLYDAEENGNQIGPILVRPAVAVEDGFFTISVLDFGTGAFDGDPRWLEIEVKCGADPDYGLLGRQPLLGAPFAHFASSAPWTGISGVPDLQMRVTGVCPAGSSIRAIGSDGDVVCEPDDSGVTYQNVTVVAKSGGDFTTIQAAVDSVTGTVNSPQLVWVAPGTYSETVTLKPHVHLDGAGASLTILTSHATNDAVPIVNATLVLTDRVSVRNMTVRNQGTGAYNVAILAPGGVNSARLDEVTIKTTGVGVASNYGLYANDQDINLFLDHVDIGVQNNTGTNTGLFIHGGAAVVTKGGTVAANGGEYAYGIEADEFGIMESTPLTIEGVQITADGGAQINIGLYARGQVIMHDCVLDVASGSVGAYGIYSTDSYDGLYAYDVVSTGRDSAGLNTGIYVNGDTVLDGGSYQAWAGVEAYGIYVHYGGELVARDVYAQGVIAPQRHGAWIEGAAKFEHCQIEGYSSGITLSGSDDLYLAATMVDGGVVDSGAGDVICFQVYDESFGPVTCP